MMRTLRFGKVEQDSTHERADGHELEDGETLAPPDHFAQGTPWPMGAVPAELNDFASGSQGARTASQARRAVLARPFLDELEAIDYAMTTPVPREELEPEAEPLPPIEMEVDDIGTRTIMGIGARAVRAVATSGVVEARAATREPRATPDAPYSRSMPPSIASPTPPRVIFTPPEPVEVSSRRTLAKGSSRVQKSAPVQPLQLPPEELQLEPAPAATPAPRTRAISAPSPAGSPDARARGAGSPDALVSSFARAMAVPQAHARADAGMARAISARASSPTGSPDARALPPVAEPAPAVQLRAPARAKGKRTSSGYRVLGISLLSVAVLALAAYIATTVFYAFSHSWVMPAVVSPSDDKVVSLKSGLAAQQNQRDRLAAELEDAARALAAEKDPKSDAAQKALAHQKVLQASIARQDEIIKGLQQSPYLRAIADRAHVALVPYDNLDNVAPGTKVLACRVAMVACREVGRVHEILPGEVSFKHPRREKMMRGQMVELQLSEPEAAASDVLFLGSAPLLF